MKQVNNIIMLTPILANYTFV